nr:unnamed protein product [Haemonchus contortus]
MSIPDIEMEDFEESFDNWLLDAIRTPDDDVAGGSDGDDMAPAVVHDTDGSDTEISMMTTMKEQRTYGLTMLKDELLKRANCGRLAVQELQRHADKQFENTQAEAGG